MVRRDGLLSTLWAKGGPDRRPRPARAGPPRSLGPSFWASLPACRTRPPTAKLRPLEPDVCNGIRNSAANSPVSPTRSYGTETVFRRTDGHETADRAHPRRPRAHRLRDAQPTLYQAAAGPQAVGYSEYRIEPGRYRITFRGGPGAPPEQVATTPCCAPPTWRSPTATTGSGCPSASWPGNRTTARASASASAAATAAGTAASASGSAPASASAAARRSPRRSKW